VSVLVAFTVGMVWFIIAWSLGVKAFDAFMLTAFITLIAATSVFQAISTFLVLMIAGTLFWFTVKALARIQMPSPGERTRGR